MTYAANENEGQKSESEKDEDFVANEEESAADSDESSDEELDRNGNPVLKGTPAKKRRRQGASLVKTPVKKTTAKTPVKTPVKSPAKSRAPRTPKTKSPKSPPETPKGQGRRRTKVLPAASKATAGEDPTAASNSTTAKVHEPDASAADLQTFDSTDVFDPVKLASKHTDKNTKQKSPIQQSNSSLQTPDASPPRPFPYLTTSPETTAVLSSLKEEPAPPEYKSNSQTDLSNSHYPPSDSHQSTLNPQEGSMGPPGQQQ